MMNRFFIIDILDKQNLNSFFNVLVRMTILLSEVTHVSHHPFF